jgi:hypothetical protein
MRGLAKIDYKSTGGLSRAPTIRIKTIVQNLPAVFTTRLTQT